jgi:hypothetical protein
MKIHPNNHYRFNYTGANKDDSKLARLYKVQHGCCVQAIRKTMDNNNMWVVKNQLGDQFVVFNDELVPITASVEGEKGYDPKAWPWPEAPQQGTLGLPKMSKAERKAADAERKRLKKEDKQRKKEAKAAEKQRLEDLRKCDAAGCPCTPCACTPAKCMNLELSVEVADVGS